MSAAIAPEQNGAARPPPANTHTHPNTCHRDERAEEDGVRADEQERRPLEGGQDAKDEESSEVRRQGRTNAATEEDQ